MSSGRSVLVRGWLLAAAATCSVILVGCVAGAVDPEAVAPDDAEEQVGATQQAGTLEKDPPPPLEHNYSAGDGSGSSSSSSGGGGASGGSITDPPAPQDTKENGNGTGDGSGPQPDPWIPQAAIGTALPGTSK